MTPFIYLDTGPLATITQRKGHPEGEACRAWVTRVLAAGAKIFVPEIADYELRRELIRVGKSAAVSRLEAFNSFASDRYVPLTTPAMRLAADLWANVRNQGLPTSSPHALDGDVILAAQVLLRGLPFTDVVVATSNVAHLARFVPAKTWDQIQ